MDDAKVRAQLRDWQFLTVDEVDDWDSIPEIDGLGRSLEVRVAAERELAATRGRRKGGATRRGEYSESTRLILSEYDRQPASAGAVELRLRRQGHTIKLSAIKKALGRYR
jgi:hypothetical protein